MKFSLVGAGEMGRLRAQAVDQLSQQGVDAQLVAVADPDETNAARAAEASSARVFADYRSLLDDDQSDAVIVSTPAHLHEDAVLGAFAAGKHVFCEKPLAPTLDSCRKMWAAARETGRELAVGFNHRYYPSFRYLKQVVDDGRIGTLDHLRVLGAHDGLQNFRARWMYESEMSGGGAMMDVGIHMTDLVRYVMGEVTDVYGAAGQNVWHVKGSEDRALAILKNADGIPAHYEATWNEWRGYRVFLEAYGDRGMVRAQYGPMWNLLITQDRPGGARKRKLKLYPEIHIREKLRGWQTTTLQSFRDELGDFARRVAGEQVLLADGWAGVRAVEIANAVYESTASGQSVRLSSP